MVSTFLREADGALVVEALEVRKLLERRRLAVLVLDCQESAQLGALARIVADAHSNQRKATVGTRLHGKIADLLSEVNTVSLCKSFRCDLLLRH